MARQSRKKQRFKKRSEVNTRLWEGYPPRLVLDAACSTGWPVRAIYYRELKVRDAFQIETYFFEAVRILSKRIPLPEHLVMDTDEPAWGIRRINAPSPPHNLPDIDKTAKEISAIVKAIPITESDFVADACHNCIQACCTLLKAMRENDMPTALGAAIHIGAEARWLVQAHTGHVLDSAMFSIQLNRAKSHGKDAGQISGKARKSKWLAKAEADYLKWRKTHPTAALNSFCVLHGSDNGGRGTYGVTRRQLSRQLSPKVKADKSHSEDT